MPRPGTTGRLPEPSDGVALNALPQRSTTQQYDVSASTFGSSAGAGQMRQVGAVERGRDLAERAVVAHADARRAMVAGSSRCSIGTSTNAGSPKWYLRSAIARFTHSAMR